MTATTARPGPVTAVPLRRIYRFELTKLAAQWRVRLLLLAGWVGPAAFVVGVSQQSSLPADTLFGRWMHASGWAGSLVVLGFAGTWALPLAVSLVAGDSFAAEDRLGTWRHLLVAVRSTRRIFAAKALASATVILLLVLGLACSSVVGGLLAVGSHPLAGLDGHVLAPADAATRLVLAWCSIVAPTLALAAVGLLGSVTLSSSPVGLLLPAVVALAMQLAQLLPLPVPVRLALPGYGFIAWHGLFTDPAQLAPLATSAVVSLAWAAILGTAAYVIFRARDFTNVHERGSGRRALTVGVLPLLAATASTAAVVAWTAGASGSGIDKAKVERSVATSFGHLYRLQTEQLGRPPVTEAQLQTSATCTKGGGLEPAQGPGNDWRCIVSWHLPGVDAVGTAVYQLDVSADGQLVADGDGPKEVNGYFQVRSPNGTEPNPLWQFDAVVDLSSTTPKG